MAVAVEVSQQFADDDLFDAELGAESDSGQNGDFSDEGSSPKSPPKDWMDKQKDNNSDGEAANSSSDEETRLERRKKQKKREVKKKSPKPRKAKKAELLSIHSETQRMVRESTIRLPYHKPTVLPISHFLRRVPLTHNKETKRSITKAAEDMPSDVPCNEQDIPNSGGKPVDSDITSPLPGDTASPTEVTGGIKRIKAVTPKLSAATDPFFLDIEVPAISKPINNGVQSLRDRFLKHTSKPQDKTVKPQKTGEIKTDDAVAGATPKPKGGTSMILDDKLKNATPGIRLQLLKEQLQAKIRVNRAENRKIQESQRKLDNEEISDEEEEEEEEMTDEEDDSDYELDKWNEDDERKQEEGESDLDQDTKEKNAFIEDEADESDNGDDDGDGYGIDSGSEGDVSDGGDSDNSADEQSVFSDDDLPKPAAEIKSKKKHKTSEHSTLNMEEKTMDLFCDNHSRCDTKGDSNDSLSKNSTTEKDSGDSAISLCLRLDSVEDGDESIFSFPSAPVSSKLKNMVSSKVDKPLMNISEVSQESSQSSLGGVISSECGESTNSLGASSDSSRIPPGQGENNALGNEETNSGKKTPELFSSFSKLRSLIGMTTDEDAQVIKKPGKLSQLTLPIEDSQDLFDDQSARNTENNNRQDGSRTEASAKDFQFCLDEDTQFTQILNTQGFINSSRKNKSKTKKLFDDDMNSDSQPDMKELLGLCSGRFSDSENSRTAKNTNLQSKAKERNKGALFDTQGKQDNMNELLGLCSGNFTDDENEMEGDNLEGREKEGSDAEAGDEKDSNEEEQEEDGKSKAEEESEEEDASDPEEMILKRKFGKKYEAKKSIFDKRNFLEEEAELSGSDVGSDEDEDIATDDDVLDEDSGGEELPSDEELQKQINKVHMKSIHDQDNADLRAVKEMFLPDGDLYTDGQGRTRHFRWRGIDENSQFSLFGNKEMWGEEDGITTELTTEEEIQRRKERYERETFLREEMGKQTSDVLDIDESSQNILSKIKETSNQLPEAPIKPQAIIDPKTRVAPVLKKKGSYKGSFLKHSKTSLSRLSSLTSNTPNASATTRGFVFHTVSPSGKNVTNAKKIQRTNSATEQPASKKPRLDGSLSDSNSVFSML